MTRLLVIPLLVVLLARLLPVIGLILSTNMRRSLQNMAVAIDVAGGFIMLLLIGIQLFFQQWLGAALLGVLGIPVFIGTYRALPAWWYGSEVKR
jgi:hypothetical protein